MPIVINGGAIQIVGGAIALDSGLCCDDLCPVPDCIWSERWDTDPSQLAPLQSAYTLTFGIWLSKGVPEGDDCQGGNNAPVTGDWSCGDEVSITFEPVSTRCRYEDDGGNQELCPGADDHDMSPLGVNAILVYDGSYLKYLPGTNEWEIGITFKALSQDLAVAATAAADSLGRPPATGWEFTLQSNDFSEGECYVYGTTSTPSQDEIKIDDFELG